MRKDLELLIESNESDLEYNQKIFNKFGDYAHAHMIQKLTDFLVPVKIEYAEFKKRYPKDDFPEVWI